MANQGKETGRKDRITKRTIDTLRADTRTQGRTLYLRDTELAGFGAVSTKAGACSYFIEYRLGGPQRRLTIGKHGVFTPEEGRKLAREKLGDVAKGIDVAEHRKEKREKLAGFTFAEAVDKFLAVYSEGTRYWKEKRARLTSDDVKALGNKPLSMVSRKHVADAIDRARARSEAVARLLFSDLRPFFKWANERELVDANPMAGLRAPKPSEARERTLEEHEIKAFWHATAAMRWPFQSIYRLLLLTGARREEIAGMKWSELDLDAAVWLLPGARTKNGRDHRVPLASPAVAILDRLGVTAIKAGLGYDDGDLVFSTTGHSSPSGFSKAKRALDGRMKEILGPKFKEWRVHDLRRTCATGMENLGADTRVVETALNHVSGTKAGIVGIYQRGEHRAAVKAAFEAWGAHVASLTHDPRPSNVVQLKRAI
jgi:integrase